MTEVVLSTDSENPTGALRIYEKKGFSLKNSLLFILTQWDHNDLYKEQRMCNVSMVARSYLDDAH